MQKPMAQRLNYMFSAAAHRFQKHFSGHHPGKYKVFLKRKPKLSMGIQSAILFWAALKKLEDCIPIKSSAFIINNDLIELVIAASNP